MDKGLSLTGFGSEGLKDILILDCKLYFPYNAEDAFSLSK